MKEKRKIKYARFKEAVQAPNLIGAERSIDTGSKKQFEMELEPGYLVVHVNGEDVLIPAANINCMIVDKRE